MKISVDKKAEALAIVFKLKRSRWTGRAYADVPNRHRGATLLLECHQMTCSILTF
jgi:hypothetical protein